MRRRANDPCWCGSGSKLKRCHLDPRRLARPPVRLGRVSPTRPVPAGIARPDYVATGRAERLGPQVHDDASLARLRRASAAAAEVLLRTGAAVAPGVSTEELDEIAHAAYVELGAYPSTLGYRGYPKSICTSVNGVVCHGIPDDRPLVAGDIVNVDVTAFLDGMHGDTSATFVAGAADEAIVALVETTRAATLAGIAAVRPGEPMQRIARAIEPFAAARGYGVVRDYGGHGIGAGFHTAPHVHHCVERDDTTIAVPGMSFTVEPMLTCGRPEYRRGADGWTEQLDDALPSAQFEHTVVVTACGAEILTVTDDGRCAVGLPA